MRFCRFIKYAAFLAAAFLLPLYLFGAPKGNIPWATYFGGGETDVITDVINTGEHIYITGYTNSLKNLYISSIKDSYQSELKGGYDAFLSKFKINGERVWGTYFGGGGNDFAYSLAYNPDLGIVYMAGASSTTITTPSDNVFQQNYGGGGSDGFIAAFAEKKGEFLWLTYYGGFGEEEILDIDYSEGQIAAVGHTNSNHAIAYGPAYQNLYGGKEDGFIFLLGSKGKNLSWGTYFGGAENDRLNAVEIHEGNSLIFCGSSASENNIAYQAPNPYNEFGSGLSDAILGKIDQNGALYWAEYYGGSGNDYAYDLEIYNSIIYLVGETNSLLNISLNINSPYQASNQGSIDGFFAKFYADNGNHFYGSYYGGPYIDKLRSVAIHNGEIVFCGETSSNSPDFTTTGTPQTKYGKSTDAFAAKFTGDLNRAWSTYYGGLKFDAANAICIDDLGFIYVAGKTASQDGIATDGCFQPENQGKEDGFIIKLNPLNIWITNIEDSYCIDDIVRVDFSTDGDFPKENIFTAEMSDDNGLFINTYPVGELKSDTSGHIEGKIPAAFDQGFIYRVRVVSSEGIMSAGDGDNIAIYEKHESSFTGPAQTCENSLNAIYKAQRKSGIQYDWEVSGGDIINGDGTNSISVNWGPEGPGEVILKTINGDCIDESSLNVTISGLPDVTIDTNRTVCVNSPPFKLEGGFPEGGSYYILGKEADSVNPAALGPGAYRIEYIYTNSAGCSNSAMQSLNIMPRPAKPVIILKDGCLVSSFTGKNQWYFDGEEIPGATSDSLIPAQDGIYSVKAYSAFGCESLISAEFLYQVPKNPVISAQGEFNFDTLICGYSATAQIEIYNNGAAPLEIYSIELQGPGKNDFILKSPGGFTIEPGKSSSVEIEFRPLQPGFKICDIVIANNSSNSPEKIINIRGMKHESKFSIDTDTLSFAGLSENESAQGRFMITNDGDYPLEITAGPIPANFDILTAMPLAIPPGSTRPIEIDFPGGPAGSEFSESIAVREEICGLSMKLYMVASVIKAPDTTIYKAAIYAGNSSANSGDTISIGIFIDNPAGLAEKGAKEISGELVYNYSLLEPAGNTPKGSVEGSNRAIPFEFGINPATGLQSEFTFVANLGNDSTTKLELRNLQTDIPNVEFQPAAGLFRLLGLCYEGGARLVNFGAGQISLSIAPNVVSGDYMVLDYTLLENGRHSIYIADFYGRVVREILRGDAAKGAYKRHVNLAGLSAGKYFVVLKTPTEAVSKNISIIR